jgi:curved DNA-binding protein
MEDYYQILGVQENAGPDEIKKAYRSLANKHHPDKGGDQTKFKDISVAYDTLSNPQKKAEYDQQRMFGHGGGHQFHFNSGNFQDIFGGGFNPFGGGHPFGDMFGRQQRRNRDLNLTIQVTLLESFTGKQTEVNFQMPSGRTQTVSINVPAGTEHGTTIRYQGLGDDSVAGIMRGNLNVTIVVVGDPQGKFDRRGNDLYTVLDITPIEAMIGCRKRVRHITGNEKELEIRPGVETGTEFASAGQGFSNSHTGGKGRFVTVINIKTPPVTDPAIVEQLRKLNEAISKN